MSDELDIILGTLSTDWAVANTDDRLPTFKKVFEEKRIDLTPQHDYILAYTTSYIPSPMGLGTVEREDVVISLDLRSMMSRAHSLKMRDEVMRIVRAKKLYLGSGGTKFNLIRMVRLIDLTDKLKGSFRWVIDVKGEDWVVT
jgi:hypothetical protein